MNKELLEDFTKFCTKHPELRFWQSLSVWSEVGFIYTSKERIECADENMDVKDTFYFNEKSS